MKYLIWLVLLSLLSAGLIDTNDYEYLVIPPQKLEKNKVVVELKADPDIKGAFSLQINNHSDELFEVDLAKVSLGDLHPYFISGETAQFKVMPNENIERVLRFNRPNFSGSQELKLLIQDFRFFIEYQPVSPKVREILERKPTILCYRKNDLMIYKKGGSLLLQDQARDIVKARVLQGEDVYEFQKLDYQYWFAELPQNVSRDLLVLIKGQKDYDYQVFELDTLRKYTELAPELVNSDAYKIGVVPGTIQAGEKILIKVFVKDAKPIRMTAVIHGQKLKLKPVRKSWEGELNLPADLVPGRYVFEVYIKEKYGVVVKNWYFDII